MSDDVSSNALTGSFVLDAQMPNGKKMTITGYLYDGESMESVNGRLDILHDVIDRQRLRAEIPELEAKRDQLIRQLEQMKEHMAGLEEKQIKKGKLSSQEDLALKQMTTTLSKVMADIDKGAVTIAEAKVKAGVE